MNSIVKLFSSVLVLALLVLGGCQSSNSSGSGLEDGSAAPGIDLVEGSPDGSPDECDSSSEGTSTTLGCP